MIQSQRTMQYVTIAAMLTIWAGTAATYAQEQQPISDSAAADGVVFWIDPSYGRNSVVFKSKAPLEDIVGKAEEVYGSVTFDPARPDAGGTGEIVVKVGNLRTGIPKRDEHLRSSDWLDAEQHPEIRLAISGTKGVDLSKRIDDAATYDMTIVGEFALYDSVHTVEFPATVTFMPDAARADKKLTGSLLAAHAAFTLKLADYGITGPRGAGIIGSQVGEEILIEVRLFATSGK